MELLKINKRKKQFQTSNLNLPKVFIDFEALNNSIKIILYNEMLIVGNMELN